MSDGSLPLKVISILKAKLSKDINIFEIDDQRKSGYNYVGVIKQIKVEAKSAKNEITTTNFFIKCAPTLELHREAVNAEHYFNKEINFYEKILPDILNFIETKQFRFSGFVKCHATCREKSQEFIILDDVSPLGYRTKSRFQPLDFSHCKMVMQNLAQLHAISFAMKAQNPETFERIAGIEEPLFTENFIQHQLKGGFIDRHKRRMGLYLNAENDQTCLLKARKFMENFFKIMSTLVDHKTANNYAVITHGDSWISNLLFNYQDPINTTEPTSVKFVDWQLVRHASPVIDISYFLYSSTDKSLRNAHYDVLMDEYYLALSTALEFLGQSTEQEFPRQVFESHLKTFSKFGFGMALMTLHWFLDERGIDLLELQQNPTKYAIIAENKAKFDEVYRTRIRDLVEHMCERDYL